MWITHCICYLQWSKFWKNVAYEGQGAKFVFTLFGEMELDRNVINGFELFLPHW